MYKKLLPQQQTFINNSRECFHPMKRTIFVLDDVHFKSPKYNILFLFTLESEFIQIKIKVKIWLNPKKHCLLPPLATSH